MHVITLEYQACTTDILMHATDLRPFYYAYVPPL